MSKQHQRSYKHGCATQPLLYDTIGNVFDQTASSFPNQTALIVKHQSIHWTYAEYQHEVKRLATGLLALGIEAGDRVGIWSPNRVEWCLTQFATASIGAVMVCINPAYRQYELEYALNKVQCKVVITAESFKNSRYLEILQTLAPELGSCAPGKLEAVKLPHLQTVIRMGDELTSGMLNFDTVCNLGGATELTRFEELKTKLQPDDAINIQFTSGTTGSPKGATLTHVNILNNGKIVGDGMNLTENDKLCIPVPLYHCFGMVLGNLACITHGSAAVFPGESFDPLTTLQTVEEERCTALHGVPTMFIAELDHPQFENFDITSLRTGIMAGSPCPIEVMRNVLERMNMHGVLIAYGQTESSPVNHMTDTDDTLDKRISTVGKPGPHLEVKIVDENDRVVAIGERGEICIRGYAVMDGYWDDPEQSAKTIDPAGWLHSGDIGVMDKDGYVEIVGRMKDMIIRGGENIYPREIEEFLYTHPAIQDVQVFGVPDKKYGEQVCAWVQLNDGHTLTEEELKLFCKDRITFFKTPHYVRFIDEYPMTVTGKIQKFKMRDAMMNELGEM
ncbi:MAG: AMP-binding protein [Gammaproteobacteria bacterium]|nr:AMP-binding protein [Gammaproteobacteria bacterium]